MPFAVAPDGTKLYFETHGAGDPLLLIAGQGSDHHGWDEVINDFAPHYQTIIYDHRGTGESDKPESPPYSTRGFAQDAIAILDHLGIERAHLYGISMGGRICQWLAVDYPERVGAVILGCTTPGNAHGVRRPLEVNQTLGNVDRKTLLSFLVSPEWSYHHPEFVQKWEERGQHPIPEHAQRLHYQASEAHDSWHVLDQISAPTFIIHGDNDQINVTANGPLLQERIPHAELHLVKGGRHLFFIEYREESSQKVLDFLKRHPLSLQASSE